MVYNYGIHETRHQIANGHELYVQNFGKVPILVVGYGFC
jgi:hypothetical protein